MLIYINRREKQGIISLGAPSADITFKRRMGKISVLRHIIYCESERKEKGKCKKMELCCNLHIIEEW